MRRQTTEQLLEREKEILRLLTRGFDVKSAAYELDLSVNVVNERLRDARRKLGASNSRHAARILAGIEGERDKKIGPELTGIAEPACSPAIQPTERKSGIPAVRDAQAPFKVWHEPFGELPFVPLRKPGERENGLSRKQRLIAIAELTIRLAAAIAIICLIAVLVDRLIRPR